MSQEAWGSATANKGGGGSDPNVMKMGDRNRVRLLDANGPRKWRQHGLDGEILHQFFDEVDSSSFGSCTCPRGADGRGNALCPLDVKGSYITDSGKVEQLFPVSIRYAANVWDYESESVRILIGGKQIFSEFDAVAALGMDPTASDFMIFKMGKDRQTSYKVVRGEDKALPREIKPEDLHDLDKYEKPMSAEQIFEKLVELGVDYDQIPLPEFTLEQANAFQLPYTKHKGMTIEQLAATDLEFVKWLYGEKRGQGQFGDAVFQAMHTVLMDLGETTPITEIPTAPPRAKVAKPPSAPKTASGADPTDMGALEEARIKQLEHESGLMIAAGEAVPMTGPDGQLVLIPTAAVAAMGAAGYVNYEPPKPPEPEPAPAVDPQTILVGPGGDEIDVVGMPPAAATALLAAGYKRKPAAAPGPVEPADGDTVTVDISGTLASMPYVNAKPLIASGAAKLYHDGARLAASPPAPVAPPFECADDERVEVLIEGVPTPIGMPYGEARGLVLMGQARFGGDHADDLLALAKRQDAADDGVVKRDVAQNAGLTDPQGAAQNAGDKLDKSLTEGPNADGKWTHPALIGKEYATKGAVTQALNRLAAAGGTAAGSSPAAPVAGVSAVAGDKTTLDRAKDLIAEGVGGYLNEFEKLLALFDDVAGKRNISEFTEPELALLVARLEAEKAAEAAKS